MPIPVVLFIPHLKEIYRTNNPDILILVDALAIRWKGFIETLVLINLLYWKLAVLSREFGFCGMNPTVKMNLL